MKVLKNKLLLVQGLRRGNTIGMYTLIKKYLNKITPCLIYYVYRHKCMMIKITET